MGCYSPCRRKECPALSRLDIKTPSRAQTVVEGLYRDMERRIAASPPGLCPVDMSLSFLQLCHAQTCGKCVPCRIGLGQLTLLINQVLDGEATMETIAIIEKTARSIVNTADCAIGRDAARLVVEGLEGFRDDYEEHVKHNRCLAGLQNPVPCVALCPAGVVHSFATISTGGFSTRNASIAAFGSPAITWIVAIFMFLSGINFSLIFISLRGHIREALHSEELRLYTLLTLGSIGLIAASLMVQQSVPLGRALKDSVFNAVSTVTTTGFATADFAQWPVFGQMLLVILMFTGACAGSTSGGIKVSRILLLGKLLHREIKKILHPKHISVITVDGQLVEDRVVSSAAAYMVAYMILLLGGATLLAWDNLGFTESFTAVLTCLGNVGPGLGRLGPAGNFSPFSGFSKVVMSLLMLLGRLELMPILVMLSPRMWRER